MGTNLRPGTFAKGEADEKSDVDIAVVVADKLSPNKVENSLDELLFQILMEKGELITVLVRLRLEKIIIKCPSFIKFKQFIYNQRIE